MVDELSTNFYRAFAERYRGVRELILSSLRAYLLFIGPLAEIFRSVQIFDTGCESGKWLELMAEAGSKPYEVVLDEMMLKSCLALGLPVENGDAISFLATIPGERLAVVLAFTECG